MPPKNILTSTA